MKTWNPGWLFTGLDMGARPCWSSLKVVGSPQFEPSSMCQGLPKTEEIAYQIPGFSRGYRLWWASWWILLAVDGLRRRKSFEAWSQTRCPDFLGNAGPGFSGHLVRRLLARTFPAHGATGTKLVDPPGHPVPLPARPRPGLQ